jgi:hypothetical protein
MRFADSRPRAEAPSLISQDRGFGGGLKFGEGTKFNELQHETERANVQTHAFRTINSGLHPLRFTNEFVRRFRSPGT